MNNDFSFIFKGSVIVLLGTATDLVLSFVGQILIVRYLSPDEYGALSLGVTALTMTVVGVSLGLKNGSGRYIPTVSSSSGKRDIIRTSLELVLLSSLSAGALLFLFADGLAPLIFDGSDGPQILRLVAVGIPFAATLRVGVGIVQGLKQTIPKVFFRDLTLPVTRILFILIVITYGYGVFGATAAYLGAYVIAGTLAVAYINYVSPASLFTRETYPHDELLSFSLPLLVSAGMWKIFSSFDTILLGYFSNTGSVGIYNVIYSLSGLLLSITTAFGFTFLPLVSEAYSNREFLRMKRLYSIVAKWLLIFTITLSVPLIFFPELIIGSLFGEEYVKGNIALPILIIGFLLYSVAGLPSRVLKAVGKTKLIMYNSIIVAILNIVLNIILIPRFDFIGAAIATTIAYVVLSYFLFYESYYYTGIDPLSNNILLTSFVGFGAAFALYFTITKIFGISVVTMTAVMATFVPIYIILILRINGISSGEEYVIRILCEKTNLSADLVLRILQRISG